ncbi:ATP-binding protein [Pedobacter aquatilis]|uniref:ATP-binding protein n=1 Tax=Pedobacter aquatilis TaxID=351343 RepID=UPI00292E8992|nr:ATP-binding protein [Pedobacter aquatilis]
MNNSANPAQPEKNLVATEQKLNALLEATADVIYRMSADWSHMYDLEGKGILSDTQNTITDWRTKYVHPSDYDKVEKVMKEAIAEKKNFQLEHRVLKTDGTIGWTFSRAIPIMDEKGEILEWFGLATDTTDSRKILENLESYKQEIERQKRLIDAIANSTPDLMYVFDLNYKFIYANQALLTMWGKTWETAIGKGLLDNGYEPWHAEMHHREIDQVRATKQPIRGEVSFPHAVLGKRIYDYIFTPVIDEQGNVEAIAGTTRDITEIKRSEQRKNDFMGMVSHELKTPLTALSGYLDLLNLTAGNNADALAGKAVQQSIKQTKKMSSMINGFLHLSSLETGKSYTVKKHFNVDEFIAEIEEESKLLYSTHSLVFEHVPDIDVFADKEKIGQVIANFISNGVKYSPLGTTITISSRIEKDMFYLSVKDEGMGIAQEDIPKLFERFYRVQADNLIAGLGIGLYISKEIISDHRGEIGVLSELGAGSTFWFSLPLTFAAP